MKEFENKKQLLNSDFYNKKVPTAAVKLRKGLSYHRMKRKGTKKHRMTTRQSYTLYLSSYGARAVTAVLCSAYAI